MYVSISTNLLLKVTTFENVYKIVIQSVTIVYYYNKRHIHWVFQIINQTYLKILLIYVEKGM